MNSASLYPREGEYVGGKCGADLKWTSGAAGAVPSTFLISSPWFKSLTRTGTGAYTLALTAPFSGLMPSPVTFSCLQGTYSASTGVCGMQLAEDHSSNVTTPEIKFITTNAAGAATDASSGDVVSMHFEFLLVSVL